MKPSFSATLSSAVGDESEAFQEQQAVHKSLCTETAGLMKLNITAAIGCQQSSAMGLEALESSEQ